MIKRIKKKSLGIVLTDRYIEAVYAEMTAGQKPQIRCGRVLLPEGVIREGRITIPGKVAALIVKLLKQEKIPLRTATVLVPDTQTVAQILDAPAEMPSNMHKYIHTEIRYSPILAKRTPYSDFRMLGADEQGKEKILIGMTTRECIENLVQCFSAAGLEIRSLEMDFCALQRAVESQILSRQKPKHLLLAGLTGQTLTICVYLNNKLDFLQRFSIFAEPEAGKAAALEHLATIKQFYEIEKGYSFHQQWKAVTVLDTDLQERKTWSEDLAALFGDCAEFYTPSDLSKTIGRTGEPVSFAGFGAAWKEIETASSQAVPELLPRFFAEHYAWKRTTRLTAMVAAVLIFVLYAGALFFHALHSSHGRTADPAASRLIQLAEEQKRTRDEMEGLRKIRRITEDLAGRESAFSVACLLNEVGQKIPSSLQITSLEVSQEGLLTLRGRALSFQSIHQFASALEQSERIETATVEETRTSPSSAKVYEYRIACRIHRAQTGDQTDASPETN
jgi:Tfp pilus assembly protein PilN